VARGLLLPPQKRIFTNSSEPPRRIVCYPLRIEQEMHLSEQLTVAEKLSFAFQRVACRIDGRSCDNLFFDRTEPAACPKT
jgi:hypothetical protein